MNFELLRVPTWAREPVRAGVKLLPRTYLIAGATGFIGRALCRHLVERGERVIVLARTPDKAWDLFGPQVRIAGSLGAAIADVGGQDIEHLVPPQDRHAPVRIALPRLLRQRRLVAGNQQVGDDVHVDDDHARPLFLARSSHSSLSGKAPANGVGA